MSIHVGRRVTVVGAVDLPAAGPVVAAATEKLPMTDVKRFVTPAAWGFYVIVVFEILYMISPFALYFYSTYGPALNVLHHSASTSWLTGFFLPHFSRTPSPILNATSGVGGGLIMAGVSLFLIGFVQIYGAKLLRKPEVTGGLYRFVRHPQYVALAILGLGTTLVWPRFLVLVSFVTMLYLYLFLARAEEERCLAAFGDGYRAYMDRTGMFIPRGLIPGAPRLCARLGAVSVPAAAIGYVLVMALVVTCGMMMRDYALSRVTSTYTDEMAVLSPARLSDDELQAAFVTARDDEAVQAQLAGADRSAGLLVYVLPEDWYLADLPIDRTVKHSGHYVPADFDRNRYKVLFAKPRTHAPESRGPELVTKAYGREPLVLAHVDLGAGAVTAMETPPPHVKWGNIPTPMF